MNELQEFEYVKVLYEIDNLHPVFGTVLDTFENLSTAHVQGHIYLWEVLQQIKVNFLTNIDVETFLTPKYLNGIKNPVYDKLKVNQSAVCYNATFNGYKDLKHLKSITNLMFLDIDDFSCEEQAIEYKNEIINKYDWIVACSLSLSRMGLHIIALVDKIYDNEDFNKKYDFISAKYFNKRLDRNAKSLTRYAIIPYDANIFINMNPITLEIDAFHSYEKGLSSMELWKGDGLSSMELGKDNGLSNVELCNDTIGLSSVDLCSDKKGLLSADLSNSKTNSLPSVDLLLNNNTNGLSSVKILPNNYKNSLLSVDLLTNNDKNSLLSVDLYSNKELFFDNLSYKVIKKNIICTQWTFFEKPTYNIFEVYDEGKRLLLSQVIDESLFDNPNNPIFFPNGLDVIKIELFPYKNKKVGIGKRTSFLGAIAAQMMAINANCYKPNNTVVKKKIFNFIMRLNKKYCLPPLERKEVENSFNANYERFEKNELDVSGFVKKQYVFWSRHCSLTANEKRIVTTTLNGRVREYQTKKKILKTMKELQAIGEKITFKKVAETSGLGLSTIKKYNDYYKMWKNPIQN